MKKYKQLKERIKRNEGFRSSAYVDILGFTTIGYGHLITSKEKKLLTNSFSKYFLLGVFENDFNKALAGYYNNYKKKNIKKEVREVLIEMIFQMGEKRQKKFIKMNKFLEKNNLFMAALEMKNSL